MVCCLSPSKDQWSQLQSSCWGGKKDFRILMKDFSLMPLSPPWLFLQIMMTSWPMKRCRFITSLQVGNGPSFWLALRTAVTMSCVGGFCPLNHKSLPLLFHVSTHFVKAWRPGIQSPLTNVDEQLGVDLVRKFKHNINLPSDVSAKNCQLKKISAVHFWLF